MENPENKTKEQLVEELNTWGVAKRTEWLEFLADAGLTDEYTQQFTEVLNAAKGITPIHIGTGSGKNIVLSMFRQALVGMAAEEMFEARRQLARHARTNEKITASKEALDAANFYNLILEQTFEYDTEST